MDNEKIRSITLRVAVFFGLTTFTLCLAIFYVETILDDTRDLVIQKDSIIQVLEKDLELQQQQVNQAEMKVLELKAQIDATTENSVNDSESE